MPSTSSYFSVTEILCIQIKYGHKWPALQHVRLLREIGYFTQKSCLLGGSIFIAEVGQFNSAVYRPGHRVETSLPKSGVSGILLTGMSTLELTQETDSQQCGACNENDQGA